MTDLAEEYGKGLYDLTEEEHVSEDVLAQLRVLRGLFRDQPDFIRLLCNMSLAKEERTAILDGGAARPGAPLRAEFSQNPVRARGAARI